MRPGRDDKVLTSWNALMIRGLARAARAFREPGWLAAAQRALDFVRTYLWQPGAGAGALGRLAATCKDGRAHLNAYLDDYAFLLDALIELIQCEFRERDLQFARALAEILLERFADPAAGGFYFVSHDHEQLIHRAKPSQDGATPSGNGVAATRAPAPGPPGRRAALPRCRRADARSFFIPRSRASRALSSASPPRSTST